jgi:hypothetical protein
VQAELGLFDQAQDVFAEVQASVAAAGGFVSIPDLYINLANVALTKHVSPGCISIRREPLFILSLTACCMVLHQSQLSCVLHKETERHSHHVHTNPPVRSTVQEYTSAVRLYKIALEKLDANKQGQVGWAEAGPNSWDWLLANLSLPCTERSYWAGYDCLDTCLCISVHLHAGPLILGSCIL